MVPRPSSPTSLLWAHQLKREHGHLLDRIKDLEKSNEAFNIRIVATETSHERITSCIDDIKKMATRISVIEDDDKEVKEWIEKLDEERQTLMNEESEKVKKLAYKVAVLEGHSKTVDIETQQTVSAYRAVLKKIEDVEAVLQKQGKVSEKLTKKNDPVDVKVLTRRLDAVESRRTDDTRKTQALLDRMHTLEDANRRMRNESNRLHAQVARLNREIKTQQAALLPSSEATTELDLELKPVSSAVQAPHSPFSGGLDQSSVVNNSLLEESPTLHAHLRRSARAAPQKQTVAKSSEGPKTLPRTVIAEPDKSNVQNSRKKRKAALSQNLRQTRSQVKSVMEKSTMAMATAKYNSLAKSDDEIEGQMAITRVSAPPSTPSAQTPPKQVL
ncbi:hypothetical protein K432DRAFT_432624 [Lepidopterella palustris CBS 459.81]|uniref:Uncharacterized protein n=1 Tax=Lepidopterella palustris CBS 459.81 TaxID=1314670 RepID=A0A8E2JJ04_9PEZI|nr:hypothetical protein K432DRAFT_432624 [Lepidopterella palustris CBS 459.81]